MTTQTKTTWRKVKLGEVLDLKYGFGLPEKKRIPGDVPVYGSSGVIGKNNEEGVGSSGIIVGRKGNVGSIYYSNKPFYPIDTVYYVDSLKIPGDLKFFYYFLQRIPFKKIGSDVGVPGLNRDLAYSLDITIPTEEDQKHIADILSAFDDKIELNNKISRALEQMAQAIFKEWFIENSKLKNQNAKLWQVKNVMEIVKRIPVGKKYDNKTAFPVGKVPILDQGQSGYIGYHNDEPGVVASIDEPVVVFTNHTCNYRLMTRPFSAIQNVLPYIGINGYPTLFVYYLTRGKITTQEYKGYWPEFEQQEFLVPPPDLAVKFASYVKPMVQKIVEAENENQKLAALRDLLLPKLMSGKIRV